MPYATLLNNRSLTSSLYTMRAEEIEASGINRRRPAIIFRWGGVVRFRTCQANASARNKSEPERSYRWPIATPPWLPASVGAVGIESATSLPTASFARQPVHLNSCAPATARRLLCYRVGRLIGSILPIGKPARPAPQASPPKARLRSNFPT